MNEPSDADRLAFEEEARELRGMFVSARQADLARLESALAAGDFATVRAVGHVFRGSGGTFGYPLITTFATSLYEFVGPRAGTTDNHIEVIKSHIDSMAAVIKDRVKGSGGDIGQALTKGLHEAIERYSKIS